jgi:methylglyoxal synthase
MPRHVKRQAISMEPKKRIALVVHDNKKQDPLEWARFNRDLLVQHDLFATGTHDPDIKALLRIAVVWNAPVACNRASADFMISSPLTTASAQLRRLSGSAEACPPGNVVGSGLD